MNTSTATKLQALPDKLDESMNWTRMDYPERKTLIRKQIEIAGELLQAYWTRFVIDYSSGSDPILWTEKSAAPGKSFCGDTLVYVTEFHNQRLGVFRVKIALPLEDLEDLGNLTTSSPPESVWAHAFFEKRVRTWWGSSKWTTINHGGKPFHLYESLRCPYEIGPKGDIYASWPAKVAPKGKMDYDRAHAALSCLLTA